MNLSWFLNGKGESTDNRREGLNLFIKAIVATAIILTICKILSNTFLYTISDDVYKLFYSKIIMAALVLIAVIVFRKMGIHKFSSRLLRAGLLTGLFYVLLALFRLLVAPDVVTDTGTRMLIFIITMILVGYTEEVLFRGLVQNALHKIFGEESWQAVWGACICTGILFGAAHLTNIFEPDITVSAAIVQALANVFVGVYLCAMYYRTGKCLWYVVIVHAFNDFCAFLGTGFLGGGSAGATITSSALPLENLLMALPMMAVLYMLPALIVLRPKKVKPLLGKVVR